MNVSSSIEGYGLNLIRGGMKESVLVNEKQDSKRNNTLSSGMKLMQDDLTYRFMPLQKEGSSLEAYGLHLIKQLTEIGKQDDVESDNKVSSGNAQAYGLNLIAPSGFNLKTSYKQAEDRNVTSSVIQGYGLHLIMPTTKDKKEIERESFTPTSSFTSYGLHLIMPPKIKEVEVEKEKNTPIESSSFTSYGLHLIMPMTKKIKEIEVEREREIEKESDTLIESSSFISYGLHLINHGINSNKKHILSKLEPITKIENNVHFDDQNEVQNGTISNHESINEMRQINLGKGSYTHTLDKSMTSNLEGYGLTLI